MTPITDRRNHLICMVDALTGLIEVKYKDRKVSTYLSPGVEFQIERDGCTTIVTWTADKTFNVTHLTDVA